MATQDDTYRTLEYMLCDKIGEPLCVKQHLLEAITNNFSKDNLIGCGGYGEVYKGVLGDDLVAVKKLYSVHAIEDEPFHREVDCLMNIRHHNIVLFVGYCAETQEVVVHQEGKNIFAEKRERLLCFEYLRNGSLHKHLTAGPCGLPWRVCYQIIKGICLGLHYLHEKHIIHLDLKPDNILLDDGMIPKIADFGLSRLLGDEKSRTITLQRPGTRGYMAPEYIDDGVITIKSDIYSMGVIIKHMVKGRNSGDTTDQDVLESWMIRLEKDSSQMRQQTQLLEIGYKEQIKACIEILQRCTRREPKDRPTTEDILLTLKETEARVKLVAGPTRNAGQLELAKFGPWGGDGGNPRDIKMVPYRLDRVTISSGVIIDSIEFSYTGHDGEYHTTGPWGGHGGDNNSIQLGPSEFLTGVSGTIGPYKSLINIITSLMFVTNTSSYGPFGEGRGTPFHIQMQNNGRIVGFFGRSDLYLNAIGVYTNQDARVARIGPFCRDGGVLHDIIDHNGQQHSAGPSGECGGSDHKPDMYAKFGPWGGDGGEPLDSKMLPYHLDRVTISSGVIINSIEISYTDHDGQYHTTGPWGGHGGDNDSIQLGPLEFLTGVSGTIGPFESLINVITSLVFVTNTRSYGPFGEGRGTPFHIQMQSNGRIVGFFGRSNRYLNAIGVYASQDARVARIGPLGGDGRVLHDIIDHNGQQHTSGPSGECGGTNHKPDVYDKFVPWGGDGGEPLDIKMLPYHLDRVKISSGVIIDSIEISYINHDGQYHTIGPWGGHGPDNNSIQLGTLEFLTGVSGTIGPFKSLISVITSLTFFTNTRSYGPFGEERGTPFHIRMQNNGRIVGFFGRSNRYLIAIGVYTNQDDRVARIGPLGGDVGVLHDIMDHNGQQQSVVQSGQGGGSDHMPDVYAKFGPWGGDGGEPLNITMLPYHLDRVTVSSGVIIDSIEISYTDHDGQYHTTSPWGGRGPDNNSIQLGPLEFLTGVSGTMGPFESLMNVITSLTFVTNTRSYGPFGEERGTPFHIQMQNNGRIVGFFGRSNRYLNAIGVYTNQDARVARIGPLGGDGGVLQDIIDHNGQQHSAGPSGECGGSDHKLDVYAKFGPWGGDGGKPRDIKNIPYHLNGVTISSGVIINSIEFSYTDNDGQYHTIGPWGGHGGDSNSIQLDPSEFLTGVSGSIGTFNSQLNVITSLTFVTNARSYGPFGEGRGTSFHIPIQGNGCIVGFFGRSGRYLNAIGVYTNPELNVIRKEQAEVARIGPWGEDGNVLHDITEKPHHLQRVTIFSGTIINSLEYLYSDHNGQQHTAGPWGGGGGNGRKIHLDPEEFIVKVTGTFHPCEWDTSIPNVVSSLTLVTNTGKRHGPFGTQLGAAFQVPMGSKRNSRIVGFFAHGDNYIEAIGAYVRTL